VGVPKVSSFCHFHFSFRVWISLSNPTPFLLFQKVRSLKIWKKWKTHSKEMQQSYSFIWKGKKEKARNQLLHFFFFFFLPIFR